MNVKNEKIKKFVIILFAIVFIFIGLFRKENAEVFKKASMICLECIGIG